MTIKPLTLKNNYIGIFNNNPSEAIDIDGNISITGKIKLQDTYGDSGAILTSNGSNDPTWESPYYFKAILSSNDTDIPHFTNTIIDTWTHSLGTNNLESNNIEWKCPKTGVYMFNIRITIDSESNDDLKHVYGSILEDSTTTVSESHTMFSSFFGDTTDVTTYSLHISDLISCTLNSKYSINVFITTSSAGESTIQKLIKATTWNIVRIE